MKSTILWGILCLVILSTATIQLSDDVTSSQFKTLIFFTLLFILYYLTLALGLIQTGQIQLSGFISFGFLIFLGVVYIVSDYNFTYFMYPIIIIALLLYLASGILFIIAGERGTYLKLRASIAGIKDGICRNMGPCTRRWIIDSDAPQAVSEEAPLKTPPAAE